MLLHDKDYFVLVLIYCTKLIRIASNSNKYPKRMFYEEIGIKQDLSYTSLCPLRILYNSKFILMATSLGTNAVVVTRFHCMMNNLSHNIRKYTFGHVCPAKISYQCAV